MGHPNCWASVKLYISFLNTDVCNNTKPTLHSAPGAVDYHLTAVRCPALSEHQNEKRKQTWPTVSHTISGAQNDPSRVKLMRGEGRCWVLLLQWSSLCKDCSWQDLCHPFGSHELTEGCRRWPPFTRDLLSQFSVRMQSLRAGPTSLFLRHLHTECKLFSWHFLLSFVFQKLYLFSPLKPSVSQVQETFVRIPYLANESIYHPAWPPVELLWVWSSQGAGLFQM